MARVVQLRRPRYWLVALALLAAAAAGNWWLDQAVQPEMRPSVRSEQRIDYMLKDFQAAFFDTRGRLTLRVAGPRLEHDAVTREATVTEPAFVIDPEIQGWTGRSDRGIIDRDGRRLTLIGGVEMQRPHPRGEVFVDSERLEYDEADATVHSPGPARVEQAGNLLTGGTLTVWIDQERMELTRDAHAIYRAADPAARR
jgi:LPS export ABC transporter protein LptC